MTAPLKIAVTPGEPAGIGPDLIIKLAQEPWQAQLVVFADGEVLHARAEALGLPLTLLPYDANNTDIQPAGSLYLKQIDKVAYVRFASVYKNFKEAKDFEEFVGNLDENKS